MPTKSKSFLDWRYLEEHFGVDGHCARLLYTTLCYPSPLPSRGACARLRLHAATELNCLAHARTHFAAGADRSACVPSALVLYAKARSDNIFDFDGLTQLLRAHKYTVELEAQVGGKDGPEGTRTGAKTVKYTDACQRHPQADEREGVDKCLFETFLSLWDFDQNQLIGSRNSILDRLTALQQRSNIEAFAGGVDYDEDTAGVKRVKGAKAVVLFFPLNSASGAAYDIQPVRRACSFGIRAHAWVCLLIVQSRAPARACGADRNIAVFASGCSRTLRPAPFSSLLSVRSPDCLLADFRHGTMGFMPRSTRP